MKVTIAIDSLKGSLTSMEAGEAIRAGVLAADPSADVCVRPLADGGEGTADALILGMGGREEHVTVTGPLGDAVDCMYGIVEKSHTAIIEMSGAAGITLIPASARNPLATTTYGVGEVIRDAINKGCRRFVVGLGGSVTNDAGVGMLQALGFQFLDENGQQVPGGAAGLAQVRRVDVDHAMPELEECSFRVACDVTNPLCGELGCSAVFGPQKGATPQMVADMDGWIADLAALVKGVLPQSDPDFPGSGAAGGMGYAMCTFLGAELESGIDIVLDETRLADYVAGADVVVTGEGRLDAQTVMGKAPSGVANLAKEHDATVIAFAGSVTEDAVACNQHGIDAFFPILRGVCTLDEAMDPANAAHNMTATAEQAFRLFVAARARA